MSARAVELAPVALAPPSRASAEQLRVERIGQAGFLGLREEWNELLACSDADSVFLTWEWLHTWWTHLGGQRRLEILAVRRAGRLVALAPLASCGGFPGLRRLEFLGVGQVGSDYLDVIVRRGADAEAMASLARHLVASGAVVDLRQARLTASGVRDLARELRGLGCALRVNRTHRCPAVALRGHTWESYLESLGAQHRYDFKRKLRKLDAGHGVVFERVVSEERRRELLPVLFELHAKRWRERGGGDGLEGPGLRAFHEDVTRLALARGWLRLFFLWADGVPAAALYGFRYGQAFSFYQSGFDPRFRRLSVGLVTLGLALKAAIEEGASEFDLLHGEEAYKFHWATHTRRLGRVVAFPRGLRGRAAQAAAAARDELKRVLERAAFARRARATAGGGDAAAAS